MIDSRDVDRFDGFEAALHSLETAELVARIDPLDPELGRPFVGAAAANVARQAGQLLYDKLASLGISEEEMGGLTEIDLVRLAPDEMAHISAGIRDTGPLGASALSDRVYETEREIGLTKND